MSHRSTFWCLHTRYVCSLPSALPPIPSFLPFPLSTVPDLILSLLLPLLLLLPPPRSSRSPSSSLSPSLFLSFFSHSPLPFSLSRNTSLNPTVEKVLRRGRNAIM
ncbi:unnamed protein product [Schistocephalus solidus]|uniref:Wsv094 n=1 Tax=Schistocephalus solidus TaxID=70667 RepID=A0A183TRT9_SCHSO|nr:unnamed protein product [Schistocephalus solidus]